MIIKLKNTILWIYAFRDLNGKEIFKNFTKKTKRVQSRKFIQKKGDKLYVKWKSYNSSFNKWIDKNDKILMSEYFPELTFLEGRVKVKSDSSNYATNVNFKKCNRCSQINIY